MDDLYVRLQKALSEKPCPFCSQMVCNHKRELGAALERHKPSGCDRHKAGDGYCCTWCGHTPAGCSAIELLVDQLGLTDTEEHTDGRS